MHSKPEQTAVTKPARILIVDDDAIMAECWACVLHTAGYETVICPNAFVAMNEINQQLPDLIILDILLDGPDGFSLLNELTSYSDTAQIPIIIASSLELRQQDLSHYGVVGVLQKATMTPEQLLALVQTTCSGSTH